MADFLSVCYFVLKKGDVVMGSSAAVPADSKALAKKENKIIFICWLSYMVAYIGRLNYSASIVAIIADRGFSKPDAGLVYSFFALAYGVGQLVNGILSGKYNSKIMVFISLTVSSVLNFIMPMCASVTVMKYIWLVNGAVQSILWSTLVKTISEFVSDKNMPKAILVMSTPNTVGTFMVYGLSALFVKVATWKVTFYFAAAALIITAVLWFLLYGNEKPLYVHEKKTEKSNILSNKSMLWCLVIIAFAGVANGFIKDGVNTWVPNVLYEEFHVDQSLSILLTLLLPLIATLSAGVIKKIHEKISSHNMMNALLYVFSAVLCALIMFFLKIHSIVAIMTCFILTSATMAMVNNVITSMFPLDRRKLMGSGFAAGLLNTFCYVGSTITSYSLGVVSERRGWNAVFTIMLAVSVFAGALSLFGVRADKKIRQAETGESDE